MSAIAGIIRFDGGPVDLNHITAMTSAMSYRGPDGIAHWHSNCAALGHGLLATTPQCFHEHQPLISADGTRHIVMDGRIDNRDDVKRRLSDVGVTPRTSSDSELVLTAFETWGEEALQHLDGDFAFAIWDAHNRELFCARDRLGLKPLHYHWNGKVFAFASDLHALLGLPWIPRIPNHGMIAEICADEWYSRDETLWQNIMRVVPAHRLRVNASGPSTRKYWSPAPAPHINFQRNDDYIAYYRSLFLDTVSRLSRSHLPVSCEVSGGLDSSAVFCAAEHLRQQQKLLAPELEGYTLAFTHDPAANEIQFARAVGEHLGVEIHEVAPSLLSYRWFQGLADRFHNFPAYPNGVFGDGLYAKLASQGRRVVLCGTGGDHFLTGSPLHYADDIAQHDVKSVLGSFKADAATSGWPSAASNLVRFGLYPQLPAAARSSLRTRVLQPFLPARPKRFWLGKDYQRLIEERAQRFRDEPVPDFETQSQRKLYDSLSFPFESFARDLGDRASAMHGVELRSPFLTKDFIEFAFATPGRLRLRGGQKKFIHVKALADLLPPSIAERRSKADFVASYKDPLRGAWQHSLSQLGHQQDNKFDQNGLNRLYKSFIDSPEAGWQNWALWGIAGCEMVLKGHQTVPEESAAG